MLLLCALVGGIGSTWAQATTTLEIKSSVTSAGDLTDNSGNTWAFTTDGTLTGNSAYIQAGTNKSEVSYIRLSTSAFASKKITKVQVWGTSKANTAVSAKVIIGTTTIGTSVIYTSQNASSGGTEFSVNNTNEESGNLTIEISRSSSATGAIYFNKAIVTYEEAGGGGSEPSISLGSTSIEATEAAKEGTINVTYNNLTDYASEVIFYESNGTTPATYDHSWLTAGINSTTKNLEYSITANTGAARTAYLKVHAVSNDADIESSLITISQAKKSVASPVFSREGGNYIQGLTFTITSEGNTIYYTTDNSAPSNSSAEYTGPIAITEGKVVYKAIAYDSYGNASSVVTRTYTGLAPATLPFSWTGTTSKGKSDLSNQTGVSLSLDTDYASSNAPYRLKFDGTSRYITIYTDVRPEVVTFTAKLFNAANTGSKLKVQGSADGITYADIEEFTIKGAANETFEFTTSNAFAENHRAVKLVMSSKDQNVAVGTICINCVPVTLNATGYATYASTYPLDFTNSNIKAYIATEAEGSAVNLSAVNKVPANTGVVLNYSGEITENIPVFDGTGADDVDGNCLLVSDGTVKGGTGIYALANKNHGIGFYLVNSSVTIPKGKAYLQTGANTKEFLIFNFSDDETGINTVNSSELMVNGSIYNLSGQRISKLQKGVNIVNGKKVLF